MAEEKKQKPKRPTAQKRLIQANKRRLANRVFKSQIKTAIRSFESSIAAKDSSAVKTNLDSIFSLMDKGVNKGIYKKNKANRLKSRFAKKAI